MNLSDTVSVSMQVMARRVGDETVLLDLASGTYFGLDPIGGRIWQLLGEGRTLGEVCGILQDEYDVARDTLEHDVMELAGTLLERKLIKTVVS